MIFGIFLMIFILFFLGGWGLFQICLTLILGVTTNLRFFQINKANYPLFVDKGGGP